ncbi:aldehyde dehydrogenase [Roseivirga thermotolerans]|uniref:Aldehyde dehydrogenase n=1 Tax=Roseivirga thermotolerans TaxID=1758176 RepID=A0ABQ3I7M9_9BACT|nr:aldehyde dehydrogenase [Roseivirga thermotolerans]GHE57274.1 aldehyde dehydrogenase [Roseivirga thermotolerans]
MERILNYIGGKLVEPQSGGYLDNIEPATGKVYGEIPDSDHQDIELAVQAAEEAFLAWSKTSREERSRCMLRIADLIDDNLEMLAMAEAKDNGKPVKLARSVDIPRASANMRFFATAILHESTEAHQTDGEALNVTTRSPLGVVACISPWNLPLYLFTWKIAPALASGNTVVAKPSEITPMTAFIFSKLCKEAGLPDGVLNIVHGLGAKAGQALVEQPGIKAISFTGGTQTGKKIASTAASQFKKLSLELGGKNPNIIFADADFEKALKTSVHSSFANQGQICLCGSRIFIERSIYNKFKEAFVSKTKALRIGSPYASDTQVGALVSKQHMEKVLSYIDLATKEGGALLAGGQRVVLDGEFAEGYYVQPTVFEGLSQECRTNSEEIFGPVVTLQPFDTEEEVIAMANATDYGLSATVWTSHLDRANRVSAALHSGIVWVNCWLFRDLRTPFGGVKHSGMGREGGWDALNFFTEKKNICVKL